MDTLQTITKLAVDPTLRLNLEKRGNSFRVRYCKRDGTGRRFALGVPVGLVHEVERLIRESRARHVLMIDSQRRQVADQREERRLLRSLLKTLLRAILISSPCGRVVRQRIAAGFRNAAALGLEAVEGFIAMRPWECGGGRAGRPPAL